MKKFVTPKMDMSKVSKDVNNFKDGEVPYDLKSLIKDCLSSNEFLKLALETANLEKKPNFYDTNFLKETTNILTELIMFFIDLPADFKFDFKDEDNLEYVSSDLQDQLTVLDNMETDLITALTSIKKAKMYLSSKHEKIDSALNSEKLSGEILAENLENQFVANVW